MIRIAICDDDIQFLNYLKRLLADYVTKHPEINIKITSFTTGKKLINYTLENGPFDIYLLDILLPEMNGIEIGHQLRKNDDYGVIIYLTVEEGFAVQAYATRAYHYLVKPIKEDIFYETLNYVVQGLQYYKEKAITVKTSNGVARVAFDHITYVELFRRRLYFHLNDQSVKESVMIRGNFSEAIEPLLDDERFVLCGASYVLNLHSISEFKDNEIHFKNKLFITPPKKAIPSVKSKWMSYWLKHD